MNRRVLPLFLFLLGWFALGFWLCKKYLCNATPSETISQSSLAPASGETWTIADGDAFRSTSPDYFSFERSGFTHAGMDDGLQSMVAATAAYLKNNTDRSMDITGYYLDDEDNTSMLPSLGLARANGIKDLFVAAGVPANQLNIKDAKITDMNWADEAQIKRGITLAFAGMPESGADTRLEDIKARLLGQPLTLYFDTNEDRVNLSAQQRQNLADMIYYLDRVAEGSLQIGGHTDAEGGRRYNANLSENRAKFILDYLARNGLAASRMTTKGFGSSKPVASNDTDEGRAKNRRVEILLQ